MSIARLGKLLREKRGDRGIRDTAEEAGISPATFSRVERGQLPDILTFEKLCRWMKIDPATVLNVPHLPRSGDSARSEPGMPAVHFRAPSTLSAEAAADLAELILAAHREIQKRQG